MHLNMFFMKTTDKARSFNKKKKWLMSPYRHLKLHKIVKKILKLLQNKALIEKKIRHICID